VQERVLIVLTDGNDTNSKVPPVRAAEIARDQKVTIYTVAVGDPTAAGEEKLDEETLKTVATSTGGRYYHANDRAALADIYTQLDALPTRPVQTLSYRPRLELFHWPLAAGLLLSLAYHAAWAVRNAWPRPPATSPPASAVTASVFAIVPSLEQLHLLRPS
jgi:Ca-activated chloride channel family protein